MYLFILILQIAFFTESALGCVHNSDTIPEEIDWSRLHGTWYDAMAIPKIEGPLCWDVGEFRPTENGVRLMTYEHNYWDYEHSKPIEVEFFHVNRGFYTETSSENATKFNEDLKALLKDQKGSDGSSELKKVIKEKDDFPEFQHKSFLLTDYQKYIIFVYCWGPGFRAYVKSSTPSINMEILDDVTEALDRAGLKSPTMTLKIGCMKNGFGVKSPK